MTRAERIEAAARPLWAWAEGERRKHREAREDNEAAYMGDLADNLRAALALPPDPDWERIARQLAAAARACVARINGEWDNPALVERGPLHSNCDADCERFLRSALSLMPEDSTK